MLPDFFNSESLADYMRQELNIPADLEASGLSAEHVGRIATLAVAASAGYTATGHLLALVALLPTPEPDGEETGDRQEFWFRLWRASGSATLLPVNVKNGVLLALGGEGAGLAGKFLDAFSDMTTEQRTATALLVGEHLTDGGEFPGPPQKTGELWLRDVELTAWRVLHADRRPLNWEARRRFRDAWKRV